MSSTPERGGGLMLESITKGINRSDRPMDAN
jgi:hypothetical protein